MTPRLQPSRPGFLPRLLPSVVAALLWRVDATAAAQCDSGIIVACTLGTFGGCVLILTVALLIRWTQSRRRRRALFEGDPAIRSYSKIVRGNDNLAFRDDYGAAQVRDHGVSGNSIVRQDETRRGKQAKTSKSSNEAVNGALRAAPDDLAARCQQPDQPQIVNVDLVSKDIIGLGFSVQGTYSDGIYVSEVHVRGPAKETGILEVGDRILSLTICTENMAYEDALALLSYATPYPVTVRLLKRQSDLVSSHQPMVRARYRIGSSSVASAGRQVETVPPHRPQTLRHPAFRGRSQSVDGSLSNSCQIVPLKLPVFSAPRLASAGALASARTNFAVPPPKPKRSLDLGHAVASAANGEAILSNTIATTPTASSVVSQRLPPAELAVEHAILPMSASASTAAPTKGDFMRGSLTVEEPPVTHVTIEPAFTSIAVRLSPTADNAELMAATESSLLEDINRFLSHERHAEAIGRAAADRDAAAAAPFERCSPTSEGVRDENDAREDIDYWQDEDGVRPMHAPMGHAHPVGNQPPASTIRALTNGVDGEPSQKEISTDVFESYDVINRIDSPTGRSSLNSLDSLTAGVLHRIGEHQVFRSRDLRLRNGSSIPSSSGAPSPTNNDSDVENDDRTSTPIASRVVGCSPRTLLTVNDLGAGTHPTEMSVDADSTAADSLWQPSSWSALLNTTADSADAMAAVTTSQPADRPQRSICVTLASDDHGTQQNGLTVRAMRQDAAMESVRETALDETPPGNVNLLRLHSTESSCTEEASPLYWVLDENHLAKSISNMTVLSSDSAPKSSDVSGAASRSSMRGSDDDATPQPLRKFGNFANLSNDELDADDGNLFNHMTDRDSISSETSTPITSDQDEEPSPQRQHPAFNGVDENLNQAPKVAGLPDNDLSPRAHDISGTRKTIEEARAQFFAEMLQRGTH